MPPTTPTETARYPSDVDALNIVVIGDGVSALGESATMLGSGERLAKYEFNLVKPALLYGDTVQLSSGNQFVVGQLHRQFMKTWMPMHVLGNLIDWSLVEDRAQLYAVGITDDDLLTREEAGRARAEWDSWAQRALEEQELGEDFLDAFLLPFADRHEKEVESFTPKLAQALSDVRRELLATDLNVAVEKGILTYCEDAQPFDFSIPRGETIQEYQDRAAEELARQISTSQDPVLLDPWARASLDAISSIEVEKNPDVDLALSLIASMPTVEEASVAEILDVREELARPLVRFRAEMVKAGRQLRSGDHEMDEVLRDFVREAVNPAIAEIEEQREDNKYLKQLIRSFSNPRDLLISAGGVGLAVSGLGGLGTQLVSLGAAALAPAIAAAVRSQTEEREIRRNPFYFVQRVEDLGGDR